MVSGGSLAIVFCDVLAADAGERLERVRAQVARHGGSEVKAAQAGMLAVFPSAGGAMRAMAALLAEHGDAIRAGINAGDPIPERGDWFGISVNVARRICDEALAGEVLVTELAVALAGEGAPGTQPAGRRALRGVPEPITVRWLDAGPAEPPVPAVAITTLLLTDLVGSTALHARVGDRRAEELRRLHAEALGAAAQARGGREVLNTGDGLLFAFRSAVDATACAHALHRAIGRLAEQERTDGFAIRIGLEAGDAGADADLRAGPLLAAVKVRCDDAPDGGTLASDEVRGLVAPRGVAEFSEQDRGWLVEAPTALAVVPPVPAPLANAARDPIVGRSDELAALDAAWERAAAGRRQAVLVVGEAGIGKSRLVAELAARVQPRGGLVAAGRARKDPGGPYEPWADAVRRCIEATPAEELGRRLRGRERELTAALPALSERLPVPPGPPITLDPADQRRAFFDAVAGVLDAAAEHAPVLVVIDDLHWADAASVRLLEHIATRHEDARVLIVVTLRPDGLREDTAAVIEDLERHGAARIELTGLSPEETAQLAASLSGVAVGAEAGRRLHEQTAGNPFAIAQSVRETPVAASPAGALAHRSRRRPAAFAAALAAVIAVAAGATALLAGGNESAAPDHPPAGLPAVPAGWPSTLVVGYDGDSPALAASTFGARSLGSMTLSGDPRGEDWRTWTSDGQFARTQARALLSAGLTPFVTLYVIRLVAPHGEEQNDKGVMRGLADRGRMRTYWKDMAEAMRQLGSLKPAPIMLDVEASAFGLIESGTNSGDPSAVPAQVASAGGPMLAGLPNTFAGFAQAFVRLRDKLAPNVRLGYVFDDYGVASNLAEEDPEPAALPAFGRQSAAFYKDLHAKYDYAAFEGPGTDAAYAAAREDDPEARWSLQDYANIRSYLAAFVRASGLRVVIAGMPVGNTVMRAMNNTAHHWQDNHVEYFLGDPGLRHLRAYRDAGLIGLVFGTPDPNQTCACDRAKDGVSDPPPISGNERRSYSADDDGGYLRHQAGAYRRVALGL